MYQGTIKWNDTFEGETSENMFIAINPNPRRLLTMLMFYLGPNDELVLLEIRPENE